MSKNDYHRVDLTAAALSLCCVRLVDGRKRFTSDLVKVLSRDFLQTAVTDGTQPADCSQAAAAPAVKHEQQNDSK